MHPTTQAAGKSKLNKPTISITLTHRSRQNNPCSFLRNVL